MMMMMMMMMMMVVMMMMMMMMTRQGNDWLVFTRIADQQMGRWLKHFPKLSANISPSSSLVVSLSCKAAEVAEFLLIIITVGLGRQGGSFQ